MERSAGGISKDVLADTVVLARFRNRYVWSLLLTSLLIYFGILIAVLSDPDSMSKAVYGDINIGVMAICAQYVVIVATFWAYCTWTASRFDSRARGLFDAASKAASKEAGSA